MSVTDARIAPAKFAVIEQPARLARMGLPRVTWSPSLISEKKFGRPTSALERVVSVVRIQRSAAADNRYERTSATMANAAPSAWMRRPAKGGPATSVVALVTCIRLLASTRSLLGTRAGRYESNVTLLATEKIPLNSATTYRPSSER